MDVNRYQIDFMTPSKGAFIIYESVCVCVGGMGENLKISNFFSDPPPQISKKNFGFPPPPPSDKIYHICLKSIYLQVFLKNNRYIKHERSHYLLAVIYNSVIKLPYYFVKNCI